MCAWPGTVRVGRLTSTTMEAVSFTSTLLNTHCSYNGQILDLILTLTPPPLSTADLIDDKKYATYSVSDVKLAAKTVTLYIGGDMAEKNTFHGFIKDLVCDQTLHFRSNAIAFNLGP